MMNIVQLQDQLKNFSQDQLVREMQMPSGNAPQFLVLGEIMRRQQMQQSAAAQAPQSTVAEDAVAAAGVPQGGLASMARAMAPKTDVAENTGVVAMASGGPVKKMREGGAAMTDPAVRAMANRMGMSVSEYLESIGEEQALRLEQSAASRALRDRMATMEPVGEGLAAPTQADLDRRFMEDQFSFASSRPMVAPPAEDIGFSAPMLEGRLIGAQPVMTPELGAVEGEDRLPTPTTSFAARLGSGLREFSGGIADQMNADLMRQAAELRRGRMAEEIAGMRAGPMTGASRTRTFTPEQLAAMEAAQPAPVPEFTDTSAPPPAAAAPAPFQENFDVALGGDEPVPGVMERIFGAPALERIGVDTSRTQPPPPMTTGTPLTSADLPAAVQDATTAVDRIAADEGRTAAPTGPSGGTTSGGGAGGIAGAGGMSSYEQELMDALGRREKAAQQDKWLALAQVGLNMMSSTQPTLLGAIGEAGVKGVESARAARDQYDKDRLDLMGAIEQSRQARAAAAARTASGASGGQSTGGVSGLSAGMGRLLSQVSADITRIDTILGDPLAAGAALTPQQEMERAGLAAQRDQLVAYRQSLLYGQPLAMPEDDTYGDVADE